MSAARPGLHNLIYGEPDHIYHGSRSIGFHRLLQFDKDPERFRRQFILRTERGPDLSYFLLGRKVHCRALEGEAAFADRFGPDASTEALARSVRENPDVADLMRSGTPEVVARCRDRNTGIPCQIRMDWCDPPRHLAFDLKTTSGFKRFDYAIRAYHYADQVAFYKDIYKQVVGEPLRRFPLVPVDKKAEFDFIHGLPHRAGVIDLPESMIQAGQDRNRRRLEKLAGWLSSQGISLSAAVSGPTGARAVV